MKLYFDISEFNRTGEPIPERVADAILHYHIVPMSVVREELGAAIEVSRRSGHRPEEYELQKGRSGNSTHTFKVTTKDPEGKGASDYTANDIECLLDLMIKHTGYTRICYYPNNKFIHTDYGFPERGRRLFTAQSPTAKWKFEKDI